MGKKKNKKFKLSHKPSISVAQSEQPEITGSISTDTLVTGRKVAAPNTVAADKNTELDAKYTYVRKDVTKLLIVIASLAIIFVGIYILGQQTAILSNIGNWIYKIGNFQLQ